MAGTSRFLTAEAVRNDQEPPFPLRVDVRFRGTLEGECKLGRTLADQPDMTTLVHSSGFEACQDGFVDFESILN